MPKAEHFTELDHRTFHIRTLHRLTADAWDRLPNTAPTYSLRAEPSAEHLTEIQPRPENAFRTTHRSSQLIRTTRYRALHRCTADFCGSIPNTPPTYSLTRNEGFRTSHRHTAAFACASRTSHRHTACKFPTTRTSHRHTAHAGYHLSLSSVSPARSLSDAGNSLAIR